MVEEQVTQFQANDVRGGRNLVQFNGKNISDLAPNAGTGKHLVETPLLETKAARFHAEDVRRGHYLLKFKNKLILDLATSAGVGDQLMEKDFNVGRKGRTLFQAKDARQGQSFATH